MSCDAAAIAASLWLASTSSMAPAPQAAVAVAPPASVASEPLFANIVRRASALKDETAAFEHQPLNGGLNDMPGFARFEAAVGELSSLDMQGHVTLVQRGVTDDLKCILMGISQDLPVKLKSLESAPDAKTRHEALEDMFYLLRDNIEVITAPPQPAA